MDMKSKSIVSFFKKANISRKEVITKETKSIRREEFSNNTELILFNIKLIQTEGTQQQGIIIVIQEIQREIIQRQHKRSILDYLQT